jgi:DNA-binding transcriptional ArsR family regulator
VSLPQQSVYTTNPVVFFHNPVYTDQALWVCATKQQDFFKHETEEAPMAKRDSDTSEHARIKAMGHPKRRKVMALIADRENAKAISPVEIAKQLEVPLTDVSYHVRVLARCKAITLQGTEQVRGSQQHFYLPSPEFMALPWVSLVLGSDGAPTLITEVA